MKKQYISPEFFVQDVELQKIVCASVTGVGGDAGITNAGDEAQQTSGDSRRRRDVWEEEEEEEQW